MICVISWSGVSHLMAQDIHMQQMPAAAMGGSTDATIAHAQHCLQHDGTRSSEHGPVPHNNQDQPQPHADRQSYAWHCDLDGSTEPVDGVALHDQVGAHQAASSCSDCPMSLCQLPIHYLNFNDLALHPTTAVLTLDQPQFDYRAQHLAGYWQQIRRPPKA